jgi:hypothetical protein
MGYCGSCRCSRHLAQSVASSLVAQSLCSVLNHAEVPPSKAPLALAKGILDRPRLDRVLEPSLIGVVGVKLFLFLKPFP